MQIPSQRPLNSSAAAVPTNAAQSASAVRADRRPEGAPPQRVGPPPGEMPSRAEAAMDSSLARLDGFTDAMRDRLSAAAQDAPEGEMGAFREASAALESGLSRLRSGLADGSLAPADIQRGVGNAFQGAREILDAGRPEVAEQGAEASNMGDRVRGRLQGFTESVMARIESADMPDEQRAAVAQATTEAFESAAARLDSALFDPASGDPIDRGTYMDLFSSSLGALQEQLGQLLAPMESGSNARTYSAQSSLEGLMPRSGRIDVAG